MLKIIFQTMIELFEYPGKERYQWRRFIEDHKDVLTDVEYDAPIMFLTFEAHNQFLIDLDPRAKPALALLGQLTFRFGFPGRERRQWLRFIDEHRDFLTI